MSLMQTNQPGAHDYVLRLSEQQFLPAQMFTRKCLFCLGFPFVNDVKRKILDWTGLDWTGLLGMWMGAS